MVLMVGMSAIISPEDTLYAINVYINTAAPSIIPDNGRMLIKASNDKVIELFTTKSTPSTSSKWYGNTTVSRLGSTYFVNTPTITTNTAHASYYISEDDLKSLFDGVKKVRIEMTPKMYDKEFKKDLVGSTLKNEYLLLQTKLGTQETRTDDASFKDGF